MKMFPIQIGYRGTHGPCPSEIPWETIAPYQKMALQNHGQTLEKLASRGGLSPVEAFFVMTGRVWDGTVISSEVGRKACEYLDKIAKDQLWEKVSATELRLHAIVEAAGPAVNWLHRIAPYHPEWSSELRAVADHLSDAVKGKRIQTGRHG